MTVTTAPTVEERLDRMAEQLQEITNEIHHQRETRERWRELLDDLTPLAENAMSSTISKLDVDSLDVDDLFSLARTLGRNASVLEAWISPLRSMSALVEELAPLATPAVASLNARLQQLDERGYFAFARRSVDVLDNVVTSFSEEDVQLLGDNIVLILQTVKQMTQPEIMGMLRRTVLTMQQEESRVTTPSLRDLARQLRDPLVRRGLARALLALRSMGAEAGSEAPPEGAVTPGATPGSETSTGGEAGGAQEKAGR